MKVWKLESNRAGDVLRAKRKEDLLHVFKNNFEGSPLQQQWKPIEMETEIKGEKTDAPNYLGGIPVFTKYAVEATSDLIETEVEILPLLHPEEELYAINVTNVIDCIDYNIAVPKRIKTGRIIDFKEYAFLEEKLSDTAVFKIPEMVSNRVFVTDSFRCRVMERGLKGFEFIEVWDSKKMLKQRAAKGKTGEKMLESVRQQNEKNYSFVEAMHKVNEGYAVESGKFKLQKDSDGEIWLGQLNEDGKYYWIKPVYFAPEFHNKKWHITTRSENIKNKKR